MYAIRSYYALNGIQPNPDRKPAIRRLAQGVFAPRTKHGLLSPATAYAASGGEDHLFPIDTAKRFLVFV